jgi:hypothetical protein
MPKLLTYWPLRTIRPAFPAQELPLQRPAVVALGGPVLPGIPGAATAIRQRPFLPVPGPRLRDAKRGEHRATPGDRGRRGSQNRPIGGSTLFQQTEGRRAVDPIRGLFIRLCIAPMGTSRDSGCLFPAGAGIPSPCGGIILSSRAGFGITYFLWARRPASPDSSGWQGPGPTGPPTGPCPDVITMRVRGLRTDGEPPYRGLPVWV